MGPDRDGGPTTTARPAAWGAHGGVPARRHVPEDLDDPRTPVAAHPAQGRRRRRGRDRQHARRGGPTGRCRHGRVRARRRERRPARHRGRPVDPSHARRPTPRPAAGGVRPVDVVWELADDPAFRARPQARHRAAPSAASDHTVKVDVTGLDALHALLVPLPRARRDQPGRPYADRRRRRPACTPCAWRFVSCANWTGGYFSAYRHLAARDDLDLVLHLGDYLYEYGNGDRPLRPGDARRQARPRPRRRDGDAADYRQRHAQYKTDPDLQAAHAAHPWIVIFDDHEVTNDTYDTGRGEPPARDRGRLRRPARRCAYQAYLEWMPIRLPDQTRAARGRALLPPLLLRPARRPVGHRHPAEPQRSRCPGCRGALFGGDLAAARRPGARAHGGRADAVADATASQRPRRPLAPHRQPDRLHPRRRRRATCPGGDQLGPTSASAAPAVQHRPVGRLQDDQREVIAAMAEPRRRPRRADRRHPLLVGQRHPAATPATYAPVGPLNNSVARGVRLPVGHQRRVHRGPRRRRAGRRPPPPACRATNPHMQVPRRRSATGTPSST